MTRLLRLVGTVRDNINRLILLVHDLLQALRLHDVLGVPGVPGVLRQQGEVSSSITKRSPVAGVDPEGVVLGGSRGQVAGLGVGFAALGAIDMLLLLMKKIHSGSHVKYVEYP